MNALFSAVLRCPNLNADIKTIRKSGARDPGTLENGTRDQGQMFEFKLLHGPES